MKCHKYTDFGVIYFLSFRASRIVLGTIYPAILCVISILWSFSFLFKKQDTRQEVKKEMARDIMVSIPVVMKV